MTTGDEAKVHLRENETGETRIIIDQNWYGDFQWADGNYSCDCNRYLFFERAKGNEPAACERECSDGCYDVVRVELPDGSEHPAPEKFNHKKETI